MIVLRRAQNGILTTGAKSVPLKFKPTFIILAKNIESVALYPIRSNKDFDTLINNEQVIIYNGSEGVHLYGANENITASLKDNLLSFSDTLESDLYLMAFKCVNVHPKKGEDR